MEVRPNVPAYPLATTCNASGLQTKVAINVRVSIVAWPGRLCNGCIALLVPLPHSHVYRYISFDNLQQKTTFVTVADDIYCVTITVVQELCLQTAVNSRGHYVIPIHYLYCIAMVY